MQVLIGVDSLGLLGLTHQVNHGRGCNFLKELGGTAEFGCRTFVLFKVTPSVQVSVSMPAFSHASRRCKA